jgi:hypothetical protein
MGNNQPQQNDSTAVLERVWDRPNHELACFFKAKRRYAVTVFRFDLGAHLRVGRVLDASRFEISPGIGYHLLAICCTKLNLLLHDASSFQLP